VDDPRWQSGFDGDATRWHEARSLILDRRVMRDLVEPNGRIIVGPVGESEVESTKRAFADAGGSDPGVAATTDRDGKTRCVVWAATSAKAR
jgi:hypothetical protein